MNDKKYKGEDLQDEILNMALELKKKIGEFYRSSWLETTEPYKNNLFLVKKECFDILQQVIITENDLDKFWES